MRRGKLEVRVESADTEIDLKSWVKLYVGHVLYLEKIESRVQSLPQLKKAS